MSKLIKNTFLYTVGNVLPLITGFVLLPIYTKFMTPEDYGIVSSMQVIASMLTIIFTLCLDRSVYRLYWDYTSEKDRKDYIGTISMVIFAISLIVICLFFLFKPVFSLVYEKIPFYPFYVYMIFTTFFMVFCHIPKIYFQLHEKAREFILISFAQLALTSSAVLWFVVCEKEGAAGMLKGQMISAFLMMPFFLFITYKISNFSIKTKIIKDSVRFSLPMVPTILCAWVLNLSDRIFIERYFSLSDVGIYSLGYKIAGLVLIMVSAFSKAYNPVFYKLANSENQHSARSTLYLYNNRYMMVCLLFCFAICFFSKEVVVFLLDPRFREAYKIVPIIVLAYFISSASGLMNLSIYQDKKTSALMFIQITGALLNIAMNFLLVPRFGAYGAAYATVLSFAAIFGFKYWYAKKCYFIDYDWGKLISGLAVATAVIMTVYLLNIDIYLLFILKIFFITCFMLFVYLRFGVEIKSMFIDKKIL